MPLYHEVPLEIAVSPQEMPAFTKIIKPCLDSSTFEGSASASDPSWSSDLISDLQAMLCNIDNALSYLDVISADGAKASSDIGRAMSIAVGTEPSVDLEKIDQVCQSSIEDKLMLVYLAYLAKMQLKLAEKLNAAALQSVVPT
eukprot:GHVU01217154.1.p1 GENE.GHVU01217154.1~~GHVU01217154.1.p1  ORF type:complete len:143 (-),score=16.25 GHVU01217154.1:453-881(-)